MVAYRESERRSGLSVLLTPAAVVYEHIDQMRSTRLYSYPQYWGHQINGEHFKLTKSWVSVFVSISSAHWTNSWFFWFFFFQVTSCQALTKAYIYIIYQTVDDLVTCSITAVQASTRTHTHTHTHYRHCDTHTTFLFFTVKQQLSIYHLRWLSQHSWSTPVKAIEIMDIVFPVVAVHAAQFRHRRAISGHSLSNWPCHRKGSARDGLSNALFIYSWRLITLSTAQVTSGFDWLI